MYLDRAGSIPNAKQKSEEVYSDWPKDCKTRVEHSITESQRQSVA